MKYRALAPLVGLLILGLTASCGGSSSPAAEDPTAENSATPSEEGAATGSNQGPVAIVNGVEIARDEFEEQLSQVEESYTEQGVPFPQGEELAQLQQDVVTGLVQQELLLQESDARGVTASNEEIQAQYQSVVSSFPDEATFNQAMEAEGLTRADVEGIITENTKIQKLLDSEVQEAQLALPTEDELRQLYEQVRLQQEMPPFEEVRPQLEAELQSQREDEVLQRFVQELEAAGTVEILLTS